MELNLIYTDLDIVGNSHLNTLKNCLSDRRFQDKFNFNFFKDFELSDKSKKYILLFPFQGHLTTKIQNNTELISETLSKKINEGFDVSIYFCTEAESEFENIFNYLNDYLKSVNVPNDRVTIASGNSKLINIEQFGINCIREYNPIIHRISRTFTFIKPLDTVEWLEDKKYIFQCFNNMMIKPHRRAFLSLLDKENLLNDIDWSSLAVEQSFGLQDYGLFSLDVLDFSRDEILELKDSHSKIINNGKSKYSEYEDESMRNSHFSGKVKTGEPNHHITYLKNPHKNAYINIVSETQYELQNTIHITEKSLIPFYFNQFPLFVATHGHVKKLKELYRFDVFDDVIDHSYDSIANPRDRMYKILDEVKRLNSKKEFLINFYKNNKDRFQKNRDLIVEISNIDSYSIIIDDFIS
jgi:hypothetical protein